MDTIPQPNAKPNSVNVFISYSSEDVEWKNKLLKHLNMLKFSHKNLVIWHDGLLVPGVKWDNEIKDKLHKAHIVLMLISANFFYSEYIWNIEVEETLERERNETVSALPVILSPCDWQLTPIAEFQVLPRKGKPIVSYDNADQALAEVVTGIRPVISYWEKKLVTVG